VRDFKYTKAYKTRLLFTVPRPTSAVSKPLTADVTDRTSYDVTNSVTPGSWYQVDTRLVLEIQLMLETRLVLELRCVHNRRIRAEQHDDDVCWVEYRVDYLPLQPFRALGVGERC